MSDCIPQECREEWNACSLDEKRIVIRTGLACIKLAKEDQNESLKMTYEKKLMQMKSLIDTLREQKDMLQQETTEREVQIRNHSKERERELLRQLEDVESKTLREAVMIAKDREQPFVDQISYLKQQLEELKQQNRIQREQTYSLTKQLTETMEKNAMYSKSTRRGEAGQDDIVGILQSSFVSDDGWFIEDTSATGGMGDIQVTPPSQSKVGSVLIEIKNYTRSVPKEEILKFKRDVAQSQVGSGIFISLTSSIQKTPNRTIEILMDESGTNKPLLYLKGKAERDVLPQWVLIMSKITQDLYAKTMNSLERSDVISVQDIQSRIQVILKKIDPITTQIGKMKQTFIENVKQLERCVADLISQVNEIGNEFGIVQPREPQKKTFYIDSWREHIGEDVFLAKTMIEYLVEKGVGKSRATALRKEWCEKCNMKEEPFQSLVGIKYKSGKIYYKMKPFIQ